jgi:hypothetical protein
LGDRRRKILDLNFEARKPGDGWEYLKAIAERQGKTAEELYNEVKPSDEELSTPVLPEK